MIGWLLVAHAGLARELLTSAEMIVGKIELAEAIGIGPDAKVDGIREAIVEAIKTVGADGVIIMTDMFGGTPSNMGLSFLEENRVEVLTGVNLLSKKIGETRLFRNLCVVVRDRLVRRSAATPPRGPSSALTLRKIHVSYNCYITQGRL